MIVLVRDYLLANDSNLAYTTPQCEVACVGKPPFPEKKQIEIK